MANKIVIVIPTYNEKKNIVKLLIAIDKELNDESDVSVLVADDSSPDGTRIAVEDLINSRKLSLGIEVVSKKEKTGLRDAYFNAFKYAISKNKNLKGVIQMDADFSHSPKYLRNHIENLRSGADLSIGSRYVEGGGTENWSLSRRILSKGGNNLNRFVLSRRIHDYTGGFNGLSLEAIKLATKPGMVSCTGYYFLTEMKYRIIQNKLTISEFPIIFKDRTFGESKMGGAIVKEAIKQLIIIRFKKV